MHIGVIGSGIAGLGAAWLLSGAHEVDVIEGGDHLGGHANTVDVRVDGQDIAVDTGFMVFNDRTYPNLVGMFETLGVTSQKTTMSFGVQCGEEDLEWSSRNLVGVFAQPENALRGGLWRMVYDIARLSASADTLLADASTADLTLGELLEREGYGGSFVEWYLVPMAAAIWSTPPGKIMDFPAQAFLHFCDNHGLLHVTGKPTGGRSCRSPQLRRATCRGISGDVRVGLPATRVSRPADGPLVELATAPRGDTTRWCSPATATNPWPCLPTPPPRRRRYSARCPICRTMSCCTPTRASCPGANSRGRRGTTTRPSARSMPPASRSPTA